MLRRCISRWNVMATARRLPKGNPISSSSAPLAVHLHMGATESKSPYKQWNATQRQSIMIMLDLPHKPYGIQPGCSLICRSGDTLDCY